MKGDPLHGTLTLPSDLIEKATSILTNRKDLKMQIDYQTSKVRLKLYIYQVR